MGQIQPGFLTGPQTFPCHHQQHGHLALSLKRGRHVFCQEKPMPWGGNDAGAPDDAAAPDLKLCASGVRDLVCGDLPGSADLVLPLGGVLAQSVAM